jgi:CRISPR/Cas system-associated protein Cas5 (RAMP superfamily)
MVRPRLEPLWPAQGLAKRKTYVKEEKVERGAKEKKTDAEKKTDQTRKTRCRGNGSVPLLLLLPLVLLPLLLLPLLLLLLLSCS